MGLIRSENSLYLINYTKVNNNNSIVPIRDNTPYINNKYVFETKVLVRLVCIAPRLLVTHVSVQGEPKKRKERYNKILQLTLGNLQPNKTKQWYIYVNLWLSNLYKINTISYFVRQLSLIRQYNLIIERNGLLVITVTRIIYCLRWWTIKRFTYNKSMVCKRPKDNVSKVTCLNDYD